MSVKGQGQLNNKGFAQIENLIAAALFSILVLNLVLVLGRMGQEQNTYKNRSTAAQIAETIAGELSTISAGYEWLKSGVTHERYFDQHGKETAKTNSKYTVRWTVTPDKPISGMRIADFHLIWQENKKEQDLKFRVTR